MRSSGKALSARNLSSASLASTSTGEQGADGLHPSLGQHPRPPAGSAGEAERLRMALRQKEDQVASLQSQLTDLEATRDRWACMHLYDMLLPLCRLSICKCLISAVFASAAYSYSVHVILPATKLHAAAKAG